MVFSIILAAILFVYLGVSILWAVFLRKLSKARLRFFCVLASFVVALIATFITKGFLEGESFALNTVIPLLASGDATIAELFANSDALRQTLFGVVASLATPLLFLVFFLVCNFFSWIAYLLINLIQSTSKKSKKKKAAAEAAAAAAENGESAEPAAEEAPAKQKMTPLQLGGTIGFAVGKVFLVFFVWMLPIITYTGLIPAALSGFKDSETVDVGEFEEIVTDFVEPLRTDPTVSTFRVLGGGLVSHAMTTFRVGDEFIDLTEEVGLISKFGGCAMELLGTDMKEFDEKDMLAFDHLSEAFEASHTLPPILDEIMHDATGAWMEGEAYLGIYFDSIRFDEQGIFDPFIDKSLEIIHADTAPGRLERLYADIHTVFDVMKVLIKHGVFANSEMHDNLLANLARDGTVGELIDVLNANESMKVLVPEITQIGVSALGTALGGEEFSHVMDNVANEVNNIKKAGTAEEQKEHVSNILHTELEREGLILDDAVIDKYSQLMIDELITPSGDKDVTSEDVMVFFAENAWALQEDIPDVEIPDELPDDFFEETVKAA